MKWRQVCDVPGCGRLRQRKHRLCSQCYGALPGDIRQGLIDAHQQGKRTAWRGFKAQAAEYLGKAAPGSRMSAALFQQRQAAMLGERD